MAFRHYNSFSSIEIHAPRTGAISHINIIAVAVKVHRVSISIPPDSQRNTRVPHLVFFILYSSAWQHAFRFLLMKLIAGTKKGRKVTLSHPCRSIRHTDFNP